MEVMSSGREDSAASAFVKTPSRHRPKKFRRDWLQFDEFKNWLRPHPSPILAVCIACKRVIRAGKSELEKHAAGKKHIENSKVQYIKREIVSKENDTTGSINFNLLDYSFETSANPRDEVTLPSHGLGDRPQSCSRLNSEATVSKRAPKWSGTAVINGFVKHLRSDDYMGSYLVLAFYPRDFQSIAASEINRLSDRMPEFRSIGAQLVACSTDSHLCHLSWTKMTRSEGGVEGVEFPLLSDATRVISSDYGVYVPEEGHSLSAYFIVDPEGILRHASILDPVVGLGTFELLRLVQSCQRSLESEDYTDVDWCNEEFED